MSSKIVLVLFIAAVVQINGHPWFGKKDDSESKSLFGLPSIPLNPIKLVVENAENMKDKISNVAEDAMGSMKLDEVKNIIPIPEQLGGLKDIVNVEKITNVLGNSDNDQASGEQDNDKPQKTPLFELPSMLNPIKVVSENVGGIQDKLSNGGGLKDMADNVLENLNLDEAKSKIENKLGSVVDTAKDTLNVGEISDNIIGQGKNVIDMAKGQIDNVKDQVSNVVAAQAALGKLSKFIAYVKSWF